MRTITALLVLLLPSIAFGFSAGAHRIIADVAWQNMDRESRLEAYRVLKQHPRLQEDFAKNMPDSVRAANEATKARWLFHQAAVTGCTLPLMKPRNTQSISTGLMNIATYRSAKKIFAASLHRIKMKANSK